MQSTHRTIRLDLSADRSAVGLHAGAVHWLAPTQAPLQSTCAKDLQPGASLYLSVGLVAGAVVALQIAVMRVFAVGDWAHIGSLVVSLAMLGFGLAGTVMCIAKGWFERNWVSAARLSLLLFGALTVATSALAQLVPFNAVLLISDPTQRWRLIANFLLYMFPFLAGAFFLGTVFLKARKVFGRVYFADLTGSGVCGLLFLGAMYIVSPQNLLAVPLLLWLAGSALWFLAAENQRTIAWMGITAAVGVGLYLIVSPVWLSTFAVTGSDAKVIALAIDRRGPLPYESGRALAWTILAVASIAALSLVLLPLAYGWRTILSRNPGTFRTILHFACIGAGYIMVEVGMISKFTQALGNPTASAAVLITGMLVFSGLGSLVSERYLGRARTVMPRLFLAIGALLIGYGLALDRALDWIGALPYPPRFLLCFALIFPPAFLMGFPMPIAMSSLSRLGKDHMFLWAWGINGCFSVVGAALVPVLTASFGLATVLILSGCAYLLALFGFFAILLPTTLSSLESRPT